jgi:hypothetical protein
VALQGGIGGIDGSDPVRSGAAERQGGTHEERREKVTRRLGTGTLACPRCDAPVAPGAPLTPADGIGCPFCGHMGRVREFLTLGEPSRPARVAVRVVRRERW